MARAFRKRMVRPERGAMNKMEREYSLLLAGDKGIVEYSFEVLTLKLADNTRYTPDFLVIREDRIEAHEVKGFMRDDAWVKLKVAAEKFWWLDFYLARKVNKQWEVVKV
jgi:hypothetical protein